MDPLRVEIGDFQGIEVVELEDGDRKTAVAVLADFLKSRDRIDSIGSLTLIVLAVQAYSIQIPYALVVASLLTTLFASFVILIGRRDGTNISKTVQTNPRASPESQGEAGKAVGGNRPEPIRSDSAVAGTVRPPQKRDKKRRGVDDPNTGR